MTTLEQRKSILNLYNSGITPDIIALEMDLSQEDIMNIINEAVMDQKSETKTTSSRKTTRYTIAKQSLSGYCSQYRSGHQTCTTSSMASFEDKFKF
jgi:hypothetical protein